MSLYRERRRGDSHARQLKNGQGGNTSGGSWIIDITLPGIGRFKRSSGVTDRDTAKAIVRTLEDLANRGQLEPIRMVTEGKRSPLEVYEAHSTQRLGKALREWQQPLLEKAVKTYLARKTWIVSPHHRQEVQRALKRLEEVAGKGAKLSEVPDALEKLCGEWLDNGATSAWNHTRVYVLRFVKQMAGEDRALIQRVEDMDRAKHARTERFRLTPAQASRVAELLRAQKKNKAADAWLSMCATGMGPKELRTGWVLMSGYVHILGTKNKHRNRLAPCVDGWVLSKATHSELRTALSGIAILDGELMAVAPARAPRTARGRKIAETRQRNGYSAPSLPPGAVRLAPYDARRAYARWSRLAGLDFAHRRAYLGHEKNITQYYEESGRDALVEVRRDSEQFNAWIREQLAKGGLSPGSR